MRAIANTVKEIREEIHGAEHYAMKSVHMKDEDPEAAELYEGLAKQELKHIDILHGHVVKMIAAAKASGREVPAGMQEVWDWEHKQMIEDVAKIKAMLAV